MFDDDDRVAEPDELAEEVEELADVVEVEAGRRLVEKKERPSRGPPPELLGQLDPLGLAARKVGRGLAEPDVSQADASGAWPVSA